MPRCKDANEVLVRYGPEAIREAVEAARHSPIEGVIEVSDIRDQLMGIYRRGRPPGLSLGYRGFVLNQSKGSCTWNADKRIYEDFHGNRMKEIYTMAPQTMTAFMGMPNMGKSPLTKNILVRAAQMYGWRFAIFDEETGQERSTEQLAEIYVGKPFLEGVLDAQGKRVERMTEREYHDALDFIDEHFVYLLPEKQAFTVDKLCELTQRLVGRKGINGLLIDPWNSLDAMRPERITSTEYVAQSVEKIKVLKNLYKLWIGIVVHPTKIQKDPKTGKYPAPSPYDAMGSSHWFNKMDFILTYHRDKEDETAMGEVQNQKTRGSLSHFGRLGIGYLDFDYPSGRFYDPERPDSWAKMQPVFAETVKTNDRVKKFEPPKREDGQINSWIDA